MNRAVYVIAAMAGMLLGLGGLWPSTARADFRVNTTTVGFQYNPSVASFADGGSIVVWLNFNLGAKAPEGIYAQRYNASGAKIGGEFRVNTNTTSPANPAVATFADGSFVVAWYGRGNGVFSAYGQLFSKSNTKQGSEFLVKAGAGQGFQATIAVAVIKSGRFIVVYQDGPSTNQSVFAQQYSLHAGALGPPLRVNTFAAKNSRYPAIAPLKNGGFVVVWMSGGPLDLAYNAYGQRFSSSGAKLGGEFRLNPQEEGLLSGATVASLPDGGFAIAWREEGATAGSHLYGQRFGAGGVKNGRAFQIDARGVSSSPGIVALEDGRFVVAWTYCYGDGWDHWCHIYAQRFQNDGSKLNKIVQLNQIGETNDPRLAKFGESGFVAVWNSVDPINEPPIDFDVYGRRFLK